MKLNEIKLLKEEDTWELDSDGYFVNGSGVVGWLYNMNILPEQYYLDPNTLEVDLWLPSWLYKFTNSPDEDDKETAKKLPVKFKGVSGILKLNMPNLETLRGLPKDFKGILDLEFASALHRNGFKDWPERIGGTLRLPYETKSLVGISEHVKHIGYTHNPGFKDNVQLFFNFGQVSEGGLELLNIEGLNRIQSSNNTTNKFEPFVIIQKYLGKPDEIFECQQELIDADYEEYTKM